MDTLQIEYLVMKMFSQGSGAFAHIRLCSIADVLLMCSFCFSRACRYIATTQQ